jgi:hypothetical protein
VLGLGAPSQVFTTASSPRSASWSAATELVFLADSQAGVQVYQASIDGSETTSDVSRSGALLPDIEAETLVAGAGTSSVLSVTDRQDRLWFLGPGGDWTQIEAPPVTALSSGR